MQPKNDHDHQAQLRRKLISYRSTHGQHIRRITRFSLALEAESDAFRRRWLRGEIGACGRQGPPGRGRRDTPSL